jgi:hypothetical protein
VGGRSSARRTARRFGGHRQWAFAHDAGSGDPGQ